MKSNIKVFDEMKHNFVLPTVDDFSNFHVRDYLCFRKMIINSNVHESPWQLYRHQSIFDVTQAFYRQIKRLIFSSITFERELIEEILAIIEFITNEPEADIELPVNYLEIIKRTFSIFFEAKEIRTEFVVRKIELMNNHMIRLLFFQYSNLNDFSLNFLSPKAYRINHNGNSYDEIFLKTIKIAISMLSIINYPKDQQWKLLICFGKIQAESDYHSFSLLMLVF
ncbi:MAG: hypothetical protein Ta2E_11390 [Mycoplasmoidaceae bacterium]|nr:MAG: hypothetical protein Ta2E_11390 [Mycoplasmoidaceae bacterium]